MKGLLSIERELMAAEYLMDSRLEHAYKSKCPDITQAYRLTFSTALAAVRNARDMIRDLQGTKQRTLITAQVKRPHRAVAWQCSCEGP